MKAAKNNWNGHDNTQQFVVLHWWTRLAARIIGVVFLGFSIPYILRDIGDVFVSFVYQDAGRSFFSSELFSAIFWKSPGFIGHLLQLALGVLCLFRARSVANWLTRGLVGHCWQCGYNLNDLQADICPECGTALAPMPGKTPPRGHSGLQAHQAHQADAD